MSIGAPSALASYAYQQAGGGSLGVLAALEVLKGSGANAAAMVKSAGSAAGVDVLQASQGTGLEAGTYGLQSAAGQGGEGLQAFLNPPLGYGNPFMGAGAGLTPGAASAYSAFLYAQAQATGEGGNFTQAVLGAASSASAAGLLASAAPGTTPSHTMTMARFDPLDANRDGVVSSVEDLAYAFRNANLDPMDTNYDGSVSAAEERAFGLKHPFLDPADANFEGILSASEAFAEQLRHPTVKVTARAPAALDLIA